MSRLEYAALFFFGKKSKHMISIERRFPQLRGFYRGESFFHAFGNIGFHFKHWWFIILPARHSWEYINSKSQFYFSIPSFSFYWIKGKWSAGGKIVKWLIPVVILNWEWAKEMRFIIWNIILAYFFKF